jgi:dihydropyrimidinase
MQVTGKVETTLSRGRVVIDAGEYHGRAGDGRFLQRDSSQYLT